MSGAAGARRVRFAGLVAVLLAFGTAAALFLNGTWRFNYPSRDRYPIRGVDVSHHQGGIDWQRVAAQDVHFAFIKATEGATHRDPRFADNWSGAGRAGLTRGAYHFFTFCTPGEPQANNFLAALPSDPDTLPPAIDIEFSGNCASPPAAGDIRRELTVFIARVEAHTHRAPILYVTSDAYAAIIAGAFAGRPIWARDVLGTPRLTDGRAWTFWQFADRGRLDGITPFVDLNVFAGSPPAFDLMVK